MMSTLGEVAEQAFGGDEEMLKMLASIPLATFAGFSGRTEAELQSVLDEVNAGRS